MRHVISRTRVDLEVLDVARERARGRRDLAQLGEREARDQRRERRLGLEDHLARVRDSYILVVKGRDPYVTHHH